MRNASVEFRTVDASPAVFAVERDIGLVGALKLRARFDAGVLYAQADVDFFNTFGLGLPAGIHDVALTLGVPVVAADLTCCFGSGWWGAAPTCLHETSTTGATLGSRSWGCGLTYPCCGANADREEAVMGVRLPVKGRRQVAAANQRLQWQVGVIKDFQAFLARKPPGAPHTPTGSHDQPRSRSRSPSSLSRRAGSFRSRS